MDQTQLSVPGGQRPDRMCCALHHTARRKQVGTTGQRRPILPSKTGPQEFEGKANLPVALAAQQRELNLQSRAWLRPDDSAGLAHPGLWDWRGEHRLGRGPWRHFPSAMSAQGVAELELDRIRLPDRLWNMLAVRKRRRLAMSF